MQRSALHVRSWHTSRRTVPSCPAARQGYEAAPEMPWEQPWRRDNETFARGRCCELLTLSPPQSMGSASVAVDRPRPTFYQVRCAINDGYRSVSHWTHCNPTTRGPQQPPASICRLDVIRNRLRCEAGADKARGFAAKFRFFHRGHTTSPRSTRGSPASMT